MYVIGKFIKSYKIYDYSLIAFLLSIVKTFEKS